MLRSGSIFVVSKPNWSTGGSNRSTIDGPGTRMDGSGQIGVMSGQRQLHGVLLSLLVSLDCRLYPLFSRAMKIGSSDPGRLFFGTRQANRD